MHECTRSVIYGPVPPPYHVVVEKKSIVLLLQANAESLPPFGKTGTTAAWPLRGWRAEYYRKKTFRHCKLLLTTLSLHSVNISWHSIEVVHDFRFLTVQL